MLKIRWFFKVFCIMILLTISTRLKAEDITSYPSRVVISVDGVAADWAEVESFSLLSGVVSMKIAHSKERLYLLLQTKDPELAYLVLCRGLGIFIDVEGDQSKRYGLRYAGSNKLAQEIETNYNPFPKDKEEKDGKRFEPSPIGTDTPAQPPPTGGSGRPPKPPVGSVPPTGRETSESRVKQVFKKMVDTGILLVTKGKQESIQIECLKDGPCAASICDNGVFSYEFSFPSNELPAGLLASPGMGNAPKIKIGIQLPELRSDGEIVETKYPSGAQMGGSGGMDGVPGGMSGGQGGMAGGPGGMGGGPGGMGGGPGGMGGGPGGSGGAPAGGGMGRSGGPGGGPGGQGPSARPKEGPSYSVVVNTRWYAVIVADGTATPADVVPEENKKTVSQ